MKKKIFLLTALVLGVSLLAGCSEDDLSSSSSIIDNIQEKTEFDIWLDKHYLDPYNIDFKYRFDDKSSDMDYTLTPAQYEQSIMMAKLTLHLTLRAYDEVTGSQAFIAANFPKIVHLIGSPAYNENGSVVLGVAEGGKKMTLYEVNYVKQRYDERNLAELNEYYFKTMHHEFGHILHQTKPYTSSFNAITASKYVGEACFSTYPTDRSAREAGFITPYSSKASDEDFVENISLYVTSTEAEWESYLEQGGSNRSVLEEKISIVKDYMEKSWGIDLDELRSVVMRRQDEIWTLDLESLNDF